MNTKKNSTNEIGRKIEAGRAAIWVAAVTICISTVPALAQDTALVIGNSDYSNCADFDDLPGVNPDVVAKQNALENAGWTVVVKQNRTRQEMIDDITNTKPAEGKKYIVWYAGHGNNLSEGEWVGTDCNELTPADYVDAIGDNADRTLTILDSCGGGAFADAVNLLNAAIGFITSTDGQQCAGKDQAGGLFTQCFVEGLNGAADANGDGEVTVQEAWDYANANCHFTGQDPTWDGDYADWVIGKLKSIPTISEWGLIVMTLLLLTAGTIIFGRQRRPAVA